MKTKILFVCLGNICRSSSAEAIFKDFVKRKGYEDQFEIDSAGLIGFHEGELPDPRMRQHGARRGYKIDSISRPINYDDFFRFDYIIGMDDTNRSRLKELAPTEETLAKISIMTDWNKEALLDYIPDPYYGGADGFEMVLDLIESCCEPLLNKILSNNKEKTFGN